MPNKQYTTFLQIDGRHPLRHAISDGYIDYAAFRRRGGKVFYFNFNLAREMGLIALQHPDQLNKELNRVLLDTFALQIINEYDLEHGRVINKNDRLSNHYMATRYLQIQHPNKKGATSGDGRGIWNGYFKSKNGVWDISSSGTGTTRLSPAVAIEKRYFKTGDTNVSYGNGRAELWDGFSAALMSEIFHGNGVATERTLLIIAYKDGSAIIVRAARNLLRPAHFFRYIKQANYPSLQGLVDYYIERQVANREWPMLRGREQRYHYFLQQVCHAFARSAALFESEYIFCWLDWDGDNILSDGGIIDYGSLRQFGLFHHEYRYDDVDRMSTTITEQKKKARYIVQTFAQIIDYLVTGNKAPLRSFSRDPLLAEFDRTFSQTKRKMLLYRIGIPVDIIDKVHGHESVTALCINFQREFEYFERAKSTAGPYEISDGVTWDAVFCMRDMLRELPRLVLAGKLPLAGRQFIEILKSNYANATDLQINTYRRRRIRRFQQAYISLLDLIARKAAIESRVLLLLVDERSSLINRYERITGDAMIHVGKKMIQRQKSLASDEWHRLMHSFIDSQILCPEYFSRQKRSIPSPQPHDLSRQSRIYQSLLKTVRDYREGL